MGFKSGGEVKPIYVKILAAALAVYVIVSAYWISNLVERVGDIEHHMSEHHEGE